jgi:enoyl-[acyl-carrier-protein] reductase (NADH)
MAAAARSAARASAREGARVFLAGRTLAKLEAVAEDIRAAGGHADCALVDALDGAAVEAHADAIPETFDGRAALTKSLEDMTMLGRCATLEDVGRVAAFVASDQARTMTAATVNVSAGALIDQRPGAAPPWTSRRDARACPG